MRNSRSGSLFVDRPIPGDVAGAVWAVLVEHAGASPRPHARADFVSNAREGTWSEWRFMGDLGYGGKVWNAYQSFRVTCYAENETPERLAIVQKVNPLLQQIHNDWRARVG